MVAFSTVAPECCRTRKAGTTSGGRRPSEGFAKGGAPPCRYFSRNTCTVRRRFEASPLGFRSNERWSFALTSFASVRGGEGRVTSQSGLSHPCTRSLNPACNQVATKRCEDVVGPTGILGSSCAPSGQFRNKKAPLDGPFPAGQRGETPPKSGLDSGVRIADLSYRAGAVPASPVNRSEPSARLGGDPRPEEATRRCRFPGARSRSPAGRPPDVAYSAGVFPVLALESANAEDSLGPESSGANLSAAPWSSHSVRSEGFMGLAR